MVLKVGYFDSCRERIGGAVLTIFSRQVIKSKEHGQMTTAVGISIAPIPIKQT